MADLLVVGTGLLGTSVALALRDRRDVVLTDVDAEAVSTAVERGAGRSWDGVEQVSLVLVAVPVSATAGELARVQRLLPDATFTHVASAQSRVQGEAEALGCDASRLCGAHPLAGRESQGPLAARADLFLGRPWVLCPSSKTAPEAVEAVRQLATDCGADPVVWTPQDHDAAVALVSHLPQVAASAVAARLLQAPDAAPLAGPGLADTTRIAASPPGLWVDILSSNAAQVAPLLRLVAADLTAVADALQALAETGGTQQQRPDDAPADPRTERAPGTGDEPVDVVRDLLQRGNAGRALVPLKRGRADEDFATVSVDLADQPGQLATLFTAAGQAQVNVEDVRVDHLPGRPRGSIALTVRREQAGRLSTALRDAGLRVLPA